MSKKWAFRDVSILLQEIRNFLLGRKHTLHPRFPLKVSPRSIPPADIPRAPEYKYSNQYYYERNAFDSVKPPVVAPVAEGGGLSRNTVAAENICLSRLPTPGHPWAWDGHRYYECIPDVDNKPNCPPPSQPLRQEPSSCSEPTPPAKK
ncbi:hypothetical protein evm_003993 [Chilo suppressalis]|nr:hypothetical protein evm_003993 [Chilo suppressalis]